MIPAATRRAGLMRSGLIWAFCAGAAALTPATPRATAAEPPSFAVRARAIHTMDPKGNGPVAPGVMIVRAGRVVDVGSDLEIPPDLVVLEWPNAVICPGFVSAGSALAGAHRGDESVSGAYRAIDTYDSFADYDFALANGTTTAYLDPGGHRLVSGRGAIVKLGGDAGARVLSADAGLTINLGVFEPPMLIEVPFYASSDVAIKPAERQRPGSRLGQFLELEEQIARARNFLESPQDVPLEQYSIHRRQFARAWQEDKPLRIHAREAVDIEGALAFAKRHGRRAYIVGGTRADELPDALAASGYPLVLRLEQNYYAADHDLGSDPEALHSQLASAGRLARESGMQIALAGRAGDVNEDLRMVAALAMRGGMPADRALAAITRVPAEILGIADRVGSLAPGKDADFLVMSGEPLEIGSSVLRAYISGSQVFGAPESSALVVRAAAIWLGDGTILEDGSILVEDGKIRAVSRRVPAPPFARLIDAGDGFVTPGFIDAHGHLGLEGDRTRVTPDVAIDWTVGVASRAFERVAAAGVTTVILSPYNVASDGGRMAAVKTYGSGRDALVVRPLTGLKFEAGQDPQVGLEPLRAALNAGKQYDEKWKKYEHELKKWEEARARGVETKPKTKDEVVEEKQEDRVTGTWEFTIKGGPVQQEIHGTARLRLDGTRIEGRGNVAEFDDEFEMEGELSGDKVNIEVLFDTPVGRPRISATLDREDHMLGTVVLSGQTEASFEAFRTDKSPVEFRVTRNRRRGKDGRPVPPKVDQKLEPYRSLLAGEIPAVVEVRTAAQIATALEIFVDEFKLRVVLLGAEQAAEAIGEIESRKEKVAVALPSNNVRRRERRPYNQAADLASRGIRVLLQSDAEDGARTLPLVALYAVHEGFGGDDALRALTSDAAKAYGLEKRLGAIAPGMDADLLIYTGHPFDAASRLEHVIVNGNEVTERP